MDIAAHRRRGAGRAADLFTPDFGPGFGVERDHLGEPGADEKAVLIVRQAAGDMAFVLFVGG